MGIIHATDVAQDIDFNWRRPKSWGGPTRQTFSEMRMRGDTNQKTGSVSHHVDERATASGNNFAPFS